MYDFRHTAATRRAERGMPLATLAKILGHANLRSIMKYVHPSQQHMDEAMLRHGEFQTTMSQVGFRSVTGAKRGDLAESGGIDRETDGSPYLTEGKGEIQ